MARLHLVVAGEVESLELAEDRGAEVVLHVVEETLCKGLIALYHSRIKYPEAPPVERKAS